MVCCKLGLGRKKPDDHLKMTLYADQAASKFQGFQDSNQGHELQTDAFTFSLLVLLYANSQVMVTTSLV